jgi:hypothetical protein
MYKSILHTVCLLHVSATHVAIFRGVLQIIDTAKYYGIFEPTHRHKIVNFKNNKWYKILTKDLPKAYRVFLSRG